MAILNWERVLNLNGGLELGALPCHPREDV
jgi:hypothetical protein